MIKRILYYANYDISISDGAGTNEFEFTRLLAERFGRNAWVVLPRPASPVPHLEKLNVLHCPPPPRPRQLPAYMLSSWRLARTIRRLVRTYDIDVVCARLDELPLTPWFLQKRYGLPLILKTLGPWFPVAPACSLPGKLIQRMNVAVSVRAIRKAAALDTGLEEIREQVVELLGTGDHVRLIPNAANTDMFQPGPKEPLGALDLRKRWPVIGYLGSFPSWRGAEEVVRLVHALAVDYPAVTGLVVGKDDELSRVQDLARELDVADRCHFLGWIPYSDAPRAINNMDLCLSFYEFNAIGNVGNCSQKVRQYLACGKPLLSIASGHGFVEPNDLGTIVDHADFAQVEHATRTWLERLATDPSISGRLRQYAVENLSTRKTFADRLTFWEERLGRKN